MKTYTKLITILLMTVSGLSFAQSSTSSQTITSKERDSIINKILTGNQAKELLIQKVSELNQAEVVISEQDNTIKLQDSTIVKLKGQVSFYKLNETLFTSTVDNYNKQIDNYKIIQKEDKRKKFTNLLIGIGTGLLTGITVGVIMK